MAYFQKPIPPVIQADANFRTINSYRTQTIVNTLDFIDMNDGRIINVGNPIEPGDVVNKNYVDTQSGGNLTGPISAINGITSITSQSGVGTTFLMDNNPLITGNLDMTYGRIINVSNPVASSDVATKNYVDTQLPTNLTGPIYSIGSNTFISSQTGTGNTFVMNESPILVTPNIGAATATSLNSGTIDLTGQLTSLNSTESVNTTTGSITSLGGIGIQKNMHIGGKCYATEFYTTSDVTLKRNISNVNHEDIDKLLKVKGYKYNLVNDTDTKYGVIAQELEELGLENLVDSKGSHKQVSYQAFIPLMLETIKHLNTRIENQEVKSNLLKATINEIYEQKLLEYTKRMKRRSNSRKNLK